MKNSVMNIVTLGVMEIVKVNILNQLSDMEVTLKPAHDAKSLVDILEQVDDPALCVILDVDYLDNDMLYFELIRKIDKKIPVIAITSMKAREYFLEAIKKGVTDFIVKPYGEDIFREKILKCYEDQKNHGVEMIPVSLKKYVSGEFQKAKKGNYRLTLMFATIMEENEQTTDLLSHSYYSNMLYENMNKQLWDTDMFIRFNSKYFLGVFPFCGKDNYGMIMNKINGIFEKLITGKSGAFANGKLVSVFASYPEDSEKLEELQKLLIDDVKTQVKDSNIEWYL